MTVGKYMAQAAPVRKAEARPRPRPVWDKVGARVQALLTESAQWTGGKQRLTATRLHALLMAEGHAVGVTPLEPAPTAGPTAYAARGGRASYPNFRFHPGPSRFAGRFTTNVLLPAD